MKRGELIQAIERAQIAINYVLQSWETNNLAAAVRELQFVKEQHLDPAIAWWESDE